MCYSVIDHHPITHNSSEWSIVLWVIQSLLSIAYVFRSIIHNSLRISQVIPCGLFRLYVSFRCRTFPTFNSWLCYGFRAYMGACAGSDASLATDIYNLFSHIARRSKGQILCTFHFKFSKLFQFYLCFFWVIHHSKVMLLMFSV